jgi:putative FmdB family regulatory protein
MPTYEYRCLSCSHTFDVFQRMSDPPGAHCPQCKGAEAKRLISGGTFHLRGSGWYASDYGGGGRSGTHATTASGNPNSDAKDGSPSESTSSVTAETNSAAPAVTATPASEAKAVPASPSVSSPASNGTSGQAS